MPNKGFVKLNRKMLDWEWFSSTETVHVFITLLLMAGWEDESYRGMTVDRGQVITTVSRLSSATGLGVQKVRTALKHLRLTNEITTKSTNNWTLITIENYEKYQGEAEEPNKPNVGSTNNPPNKPTNYIRNKEIKKYIYMRFEDFWKLYPKKKGKESAKKAWEKLNPSDELVETILSAVQRQMSSNDWTKDGGQFIPYPATWLNGHRWEDEEVEQLSELERWARGELL